MKNSVSWSVKGLIIILTLCAGLFGQLTVASAAPRTIIDNCDPTKMTDLQFVQCVGNAEIQKRITDLNTLIAKMNQLIAFIQSKSPNSTIQGDLQGIIADANANISGGTTNGVQVAGLNALKAKLDAETTAQIARADVKSIYTGYRIYELVLPRDFNQARMFHLMWASGVITQLISGNPAFSGTPTPGQPTCPPGQSRTVQGLLACANQVLTAENGLYASSTLVVTNYNDTTTDQTIKQLRQDNNAADHYLNAAVILINAVCNKTPGCRSTTPSPTPSA